MLELYANIKRIREERGMSQEELAKLVGFKSRSSINKIELGVNDITQSKLIAIAKALHVSPATLMGEDTDVPAPAGQSGKQSTGGTEGEMEEGGTILMRAQNELDPDELQQLENMAEYFLDKKLKGK